MLTSFEDIKRLLRAKGQDFVDLFSLDIKEELIANIEDTLYSRPESEFYRRTGDFLDAVTISDSYSSGTKTAKEIYINPDLLSLGGSPFYYDSDSKHKMFGEHIGVHGEDMRSKLVNGMIEEGYNTMNGKWIEGTHMVALTKNWVRQSMNESKIHAILKKTDAGIIIKKK